jgi:hypothetical protein
MSIDFSKPTAGGTDLEEDILTELRLSKAALGKWFEGETLTNAPVGTKRWTNRPERFDGTAWQAADMSGMPFQAVLGFTPINKAGDTGVGGLQGGSFIATGTSVGEARLSPGSAAATGYVEFYNPAHSARIGFIGFAGNTGPILYSGIGGHQFDNPITVSSAGVDVEGLLLGAGAGTARLRRILSGASYNLHLDAAAGQATYLNYYGGNNINFGNGANGVIGALSTIGALSVASSLDNGYGGGAGYLILSRGNASRTGIMGVYSAGNVRQGFFGYNDGNGLNYDTDGYGIHLFNQDVQFNSGIGVKKVGYRGVPLKAVASGYTLIAGDAGLGLALAGPATIPANVLGVSDNDAVILYNDTVADVLITQGASLTLRKDGTALTGNVTLKARGRASIWFRSATEAIIGGALV